MYSRVQKLYLVNNVLENQIWAVPLLLVFVPEVDEDTDDDMD